MQSLFSFTTRRAAEIAGVEQHIVQTALQRHGHWLGVVPRKLPNGRLLWPAVAVYQALGKLPPVTRHTPATRLRETVCNRLPDADPFHVQKAADALMAEHPHGATLVERRASIWADLAHHQDLTAKLTARLRHFFDDEEHMTDLDFMRLNVAAEDLASRFRELTDVLRWRTPAVPQGEPGTSTMFGGAPR